TTTAPVSPSRAVSSRPMPFDAPVTTTTRPQRLKRPAAVAADWRTQLEAEEIRSDTILLALAIPLSCRCRTRDQKPRHAVFKTKFRIRNHRLRGLAQIRTALEHRRVCNFAVRTFKDSTSIITWAVSPGIRPHIPGKR